MTTTRKIYLLSGASVLLSLSSGAAPLMHHPLLVTLTTGSGFLILLVAIGYDIRAAREARARRRALIGLRTSMEATRTKHTDEVRELEDFLTSLLCADNLAFPLRVVGSRGGHYLLFFEAVSNVQPLQPNGQPTRYRLCCNVPIQHPDLYVRIYTTLIAQVLMLTTDEAQFRDIARISP